MRSSFISKRSLLLLSLLSSCAIPVLNAVKVEAPEEVEEFKEKKETYEYNFLTNKGIKTHFGGYIKAEYFYDSRQVLGYSTDQILLFPKPQKLDPCGNDINGRGEGHAAAIESRFGFSFDGTKVGCADLSGLLEGDFWLIPKVESDPIAADLFRLRHAAIFLKWPDITLTMGQYWHPIFIGECFPHTVGFNDGTPFDPYARSPLVMVDFDAGDQFHFIGCASFQLDYCNLGPLILKETDLLKDAGSPRYMGLSLVPNLNFSFKKFFGDHAAGAGIDYNRFVPRIVSDEGYAVIEPLSAVNAIAWIALNWPHIFEYHSKISYCQNATGYKVLGGFGTHEIECEESGRRDYANISSLNIWWDLIALPECTVEPAVFVGYAKNVGSMKSIIPSDAVFGIGVNEEKGAAIDHVIRVSPRTRWRITESLTLAAEFEFTRAAYGTIQTNGRVEGLTPVNNFRGMLASYYWF